MRKTLVLIMLFSSVVVAEASEPDYGAQANAAYDAKQYARCAELYEKLAASAGDHSGSLYNAACCHARDGKADRAFALLDRVVKAGFVELDDVQADTDLGSLHTDRRWTALIDGVKANVAKMEKAIGDPALRREILAMMQIDQTARKALIAGGFKDKDKLASMNAIDRKNTARMKEIVAARGWPGKALVGKDGASAAWLLVQHADLDVAFQKLCLAKMEPLVKSRDIEAQQYAYLVDRVAVAEKRKQTYGTQFNDKRQPQPIEDEEHVDERRKAVGLGTMEEYRAQMLRMYGPAK
jgi:hypothetical protein